MDSKISTESVSTNSLPQWNKPELKRLSLKDAESTSSFHGSDGSTYS